MKIHLSLLLIVFLFISCQTQKTKNVEKANTVEESIVVDTKNNTTDDSGRWKCEKEICLQLRNLDKKQKTFEIFMINSVPIFGFQCDLPGIDIINSSGGLLEENEYQTSNSISRLLSFSMQAKAIPVGMGVLTKVHFKNPLDEVCMTEIIFAGIGGSKLSNNNPDCIKLD